MSPTPSPSDQPFITHDDITPALRKRLEQLMQYGSDKEKIGDFDYAHSMYSQCVAKDPSNLGYVEALLNNLGRKYEGKKKKCRVRANRNPFKKALADQAWREAIRLGTELLGENPWDTATLRGMADACAALRFNEVELRYLKNALDGNPKDVDVNRHCAISLTRMGQYDQAIACWHRIEDKVKAEALKNISDLTMTKSRPALGLGDGPDTQAESKPKSASAPERPSGRGDTTANSSPSVSSDKTPTARPMEVAKPVAGELSLAQLETKIVRHPEEIANYLRLAELLDAQGKYKEAEQVLRRAMPISGGDLTVREQLEKIQIRRSKSYVVTAEKQALENPSEDTKTQLERIRKQHNRMELEIYSARAERYPQDLALQYEVGVRLKRANNFAEAIPYFELAESDPRCQGPASLARGECLQQMRQYAAALKCYELAAQSNEGELEKLALYRAGVLATGLKDLPRARNYLEKLVKIEPGYRDAASRLDKLG